MHNYWTHLWASCNVHLVSATCALQNKGKALLCFTQESKMFYQGQRSRLASLQYMHHRCRYRLHYQQCLFCTGKHERNLSSVQRFKLDCSNDCVMSKPKHYYQYQKPSVSRKAKQQLLGFMDEVSEELEKGCQEDVLIMDFLKAFDKVSHSLLVHKLWQ